MKLENEGCVSSETSGSTFRYSLTIGVDHWYHVRSLMAAGVGLFCGSEGEKKSCAMIGSG